MDIEVCLEAKRVADNQLDNAIEEINRLKTLNEDSHAELELMIRKVANTEKDRDQMKNIMVQNITESNSKIQGYLMEITELRNKIIQIRTEAASSE